MPHRPARRVAGLLLLCASLAAVAHAGAKPAAEPHRSPGLWDQQLTVDGGAFPISPTQLCLDRAADARMTLVGAQMTRGHCSEYRLGRGKGSSWSFRSVCGISGGGVVTTTGRATGDFRTRYRIEATGVTSGAADPALNLSHSIVLEARRRGPCPANLRGGDVVIGDRTVNVLDGLPR